MRADFFTVFAAFMASQSAISSTPGVPQPSKQQEYYPLWWHVTKLKQMGGGGGSWERRCNLCKIEKTFKGSYTRVKAHILHEVGKGVEACAFTKNSEVRATFKREHDDAQRLKDHRAKIGMGRALTGILLALVLAMSQGLFMKQGRGGRSW
jgi:hypothetical protein